MLASATRAFAIAALVFSVGCAARVQPAYQIGAAPAATAPLVRFVDNRPPIEKTTQSGKAGGLFSHPEPILWYGDDRFTPSRVEVLEQKVSAELGERLAGKRLVLTKFEVANRWPQQARRAQRAQAGVALGLVGMVVNEAFSESSDVSDHIACSIEGLVGEKQFRASAKESYSLQDFWSGTVLDDPGVTQAMKEALNECTDAAVREVEASCDC